MKNHYAESWSLYKAQSESFKDDFEYYLDLCFGKKTLEVFAGYGRLSNYLISKGVDLETVELEPKFAKYINLPTERNHIGDVLTFESKERYERIIGAYNSFCLFLSDEDINRFFRLMSALLAPGGILSLSYYPLDSWVEHPQSEVFCENVTYQYRSFFDLSNIKNDIAVWMDEFKTDTYSQIFKYPTRVYSCDQKVTFFAEQAGLKPVTTVINYNKKIDGERWVEYVFTKA
jgi:SAM-dependent methyltransferase